MTVFKGYLLVMKTNLPIIFLYFVITTGITIGISGALKSTPTQNFEATKLNVGIVDEDGSELAKGLANYIQQIHDTTILKNDDSVVRENLFYNNVEYVMYIPSDFEKLSLKEGQPIKIVSQPDVYSTFYIEQRIDEFINGISVYQASGYSNDVAIKLLLDKGKTEAEVNILDMNGNAGKREGYSYMLEYLPYLFITAICSSLSVVIAVFNNKEIKRKMLSSPISLRRQNLEQLAAFLILGCGFLLASLLIMTGFYKMAFWNSANLRYFLGNIICFLIVSLALAFGVGVLMKNNGVITNITTVLSLVLCFLGGVFVPISLLGDGVKKVGKFLPTYWYETNLQILLERTNMTAKWQAEIFKGYGMQLVFAFACLAVVLAVVKYRSQES